MPPVVPAGYHHFFATNPSSPTYWASWMFGWAFSATSATVVSGAMAERARFRWDCWPDPDCCKPDVATLASATTAL